MGIFCWWILYSLSYGDRRSCTRYKGHFASQGGPGRVPRGEKNQRGRQKALSVHWLSHFTPSKLGVFVYVNYILSFFCCCFFKDKLIIVEVFLFIVRYPKSVRRKSLMMKLKRRRKKRKKKRPMERKR